MHVQAVKEFFHLPAGITETDFVEAVDNGFIGWKLVAAYERFGWHGMRRVAETKTIWLEALKESGRFEASARA